MSDAEKKLREELDAAQGTISELRSQLAVRMRGQQQSEQELMESRSALLFMLEDLEAARKQIEQAHQEWMAALDAVADPIFLHDREFRILRANRAYQQHAGVSFEELIGRPYFELFPRIDGPLPGCRQAVENLAAGMDGEIEVEGRLYRSRAFPVQDAQGAYLYSVHSLEDITEQKVIDAAVRSSEERYRRLFDNMLNGFAYCRMLFEDGRPSDFIYLEVNQAFERHTGLKDVTGKKVSEVIPGIRESDPHLFEVYGRVAAGGPPEQFEIHVEALQMWFNVSVYCPQPEHFVAVFDVITERKQAEEKLRNEALRRRLLMESSLDGIAIINQQHQVVESNSRFAEMLGYTQQEMPGLHTWDFEAMLSEAEIRSNFANLLDTSMTIETRHRRKDGSMYDVEVSLGGTLVDGEPMVFTVSRDISERKQHEAAMQRANRALRTLSAGNETLIHADNEIQLLNQMCEVAVQVGGYRMAWIGYARDSEEKPIERMAQAGFEADSPELLSLCWDDRDNGLCPACAAVTQHKTCVVQDIQSSTIANPWHEHALQCGYTSCIALPLLDGEHAFGVLVLFDDRTNVFDEDEVRLLEEMAGDLAFGILTLRIKEAHREHEQRLQKNMLQTVEAIASIVEMRDPYTSGHQVRVAGLAREIAKQMGLPDEMQQVIHLAGVVHDLGKISVPAEILSKPGRLNEVEYSLIKMHPQAGYDILKGIDFSWPIAQMVLQHHERLDGSGYPHGLKGDEILLGSRILSVADTVEAMSSHRPYRPGLGDAAALHEIVRGRGTLFDAQVVDACVALFKEHGYALSI